MIYTSYYARYNGTNGVSISCGVPKGLVVLRCKELEPAWGLVNQYKRGKITKKQYRTEYVKQLKALNVDKFAKTLEGKVLLCYETPEDFCHRSIVRKWFNHYGYTCIELDETLRVEPLIRRDVCLNCNHYEQQQRVCSNTGEVITQERVQGCSDWRYFC